ncbi:MAG TPA: nuclear transport factor 2 family protein [Solirubrobacteraceae bacterium]|jgi:ketosteroid isomerase-like protein
MPAREQLFADIDSMEPERFAAHLAEDVTMRFGNAEPIRGKDAVRDAWATFCKELRGVRHEVVGRWRVDEDTIVEARVTYTRSDSSQVTVPVVTIYRERGGRINDYRIYVDLAPLFAGRTGTAGA